ncbi:MAG: DNA-processing protein DprA [bacterium]
MKNIFNKILPENFPKPLLEIPQPPKQLFTEGTLPSLDDYIFLTVVGSRKCSNYGKDACEKIISELAGQNIVIVSGLAYGIDTIAHKKAMEVGLKTVAVPGSGLDRKVLYPSLNRKLADEIIEKDGALLSEFDLDQTATLYTFPQRNRIMAGLSKAILVIEAGEKSGTLITARLATEYNRDLLVIPGSIFSPNSVGSNKLINLGATPVSSGEEVLKSLGIDTETKQKSLDLESDDFSDNEKMVLKILTTEPLIRDELLRKIELPISEANTLLSIMEIKGLITESLGEIRINL